MSNIKQVVFVDPSVEDYQFLVRGVDNSIPVYLLPWNKDGVLFIEQTLEQYRQLDAVHIISHGCPGAIVLGRAMLDATSIDHYAEVLRKIGQSLNSGGDILLHACELAARTNGAWFVERFAALTGKGVAAATERLGNGRWFLDKLVGLVEANYPIPACVRGSYPHVLASTFAKRKAAIWRLALCANAEPRPHHHLSHQTQSASKSTSVEGL